MVASDNGKHRNRFGGGDREVVKTPPLCESGSVGAHAVRTAANAQKLSGPRVETLPQGFEVPGVHRAAQPQQLRAAPVPFAHHTLALCIVVAVFEMPRRVPFAVCHGAYRQHRVDLRLDPWTAGLNALDCGRALDRLRRRIDPALIPHADPDSNQEREAG